jgi:hypothetical protein
VPRASRGYARLTSRCYHARPSEERRETRRTCSRGTTASGFSSHGLAVVEGIVELPYVDLQDPAIPADATAVTRSFDSGCYELVTFDAADAPNRRGTRVARCVLSGDNRDPSHDDHVEPPGTPHPCHNLAMTHLPAGDRWSGSRHRDDTVENGQGPEACRARAARSPPRPTTRCSSTGRASPHHYGDVRGFADREESNIDTQRRCVLLSGAQV